MARVEAIEKLRAAVRAGEVEMTALRSYSTYSIGTLTVAPTEDPEYKRVSTEVAGLKRRLAEMETKDSSPLENLYGGKQGKYLDLIGKVKFNKALLGMLSKRYEMAVLAQEKDSPTVQIIQEAFPPKTRENKTMLMVSLGFTAGFLVSVFVAFLLEFLETAHQDPESSAKLEALKKYLKGIKP